MTPLGADSWTDLATSFQRFLDTVAMRNSLITLALLRILLALDGATGGATGANCDAALAAAVTWPCG